MEKIFSKLSLRLKKGMKKMVKLENVNKYFNRHKKNEIHIINNTTLEFENTGLVALLRRIRKRKNNTPKRGRRTRQNKQRKNIHKRAKNNQKNSTHNRQNKKPKYRLHIPRLQANRQPISIRKHSNGAKNGAE